MLPLKLSDSHPTKVKVHDVFSKTAGLRTMNAANQASRLRQVPLQEHFGHLGSATHTRTLSPFIPLNASGT
jgi:hypothetical protein